VRSAIFRRHLNGNHSSSRGQSAKGPVVQTYPLLGPKFSSMLRRHNVSALFKTSQGWQRASLLECRGKPAAARPAHRPATRSLPGGTPTACRNPPGARPSNSSARTRTRRARSRSFQRSTPRHKWASSEFPVVRVRLSQMALRRPRQWGACWLGCRLWEQLGLGEFWCDKLTPSREGTRWDQVLQTLVLYRLIDPGSQCHFAAAPALV